MWSVLVVFGFPFLQFSSQIPFMFEMPSLVELLRIGFMASLDLSVHFWATWRYMFVGDAEIGEMPGELGSEGRTVIGLNLLNSEGEVLADLLKKVDGGLGVVVVVDAQDAKSGRFIDGCELIKALARFPTRGTNFTSSCTERPGTCRGASGGLGPGDTSSVGPAQRDDDERSSGSSSVIRRRDSAVEDRD